MLLDVLQLDPMAKAVAAKGFEIINEKTTDGAALPASVKVGGENQFEIAQRTVAQQIKFNNWKPLNVLVEVIPSHDKSASPVWADPTDILFS